MYSTLGTFRVAQRPIRVAFTRHPIYTLSISRLLTDCAWLQRGHGTLLSVAGSWRMAHRADAGLRASTTRVDKLGDRRRTREGSHTGQRSAIRYKKPTESTYHEGPALHAVVHR